ncbi:MAG: MFS transporter [Rhodospirillaceae bacterium]|nr:MFS transporter [Rhodospirillaceae bacterium]
MKALYKPSDADHPHRWIILGGVWLIYFSFGLTVAALGPLVGSITEDLQISYGEMGTVLGAWPFVYILAAMPCGFLIDRIGPRKALFLAAVLMATSGFLRSCADSHLTMAIAVAIFGLGGPMISIGAPKVIALLFQGKDRGLAMGIYITGPGLGAVIAIAITNSLLLPALYDNWRLVTGSYAVFTLIAGFIWTLLSLNPSGRFIESNASKGAEEAVVRTFRRLASIPSVQLVLIMSVGIFFINHGLNNWLPEIIREHGVSAAEAGYWAAIPTGISVLSALIIPRLASPERRIFILGFLIFSSSCATLLLHFEPGPTLIMGLLLQGIARGAMMTVALLLLVEIPNIGPKRAGTAGGLFFTAAEIGGVAGPITIGLFHDITGGFSTSLLLLTTISFLLLAVLFPLRQSLQKSFNT